MKIAVINKLCLAAMLALGVGAAALAGPPQGGRPMPGQPGDFRQRGGDFAPQDHRSQIASDQEQRRGGRLSADERRELRRQINEVGQDIYRVKR
ncbi:hypothetical protein GWL_15810 [Herbaspirillum sp. GW103]|jgi:hypothetical protein|uniref:hypothetical protein n=1 Tax=unclassified Herbaspirillum TaxID=2624150 RepID=UPI00025E47CA|nr:MULTISPECIES: hypothetical protein [unclassified Herbaspirillum]EIJ47340.1 hypothetical protein GWL_15810 [Herbaspirillum sp. GW103]MCI1004901.1 hypothetical protein [Herbaspirillum sp. C7C8]NUT59760.1 hypothetical protein [Herbaspirillum sp. C9C3]